MPSSIFFKYEYNKSPHIECEVPTNQILRQSATKEEEFERGTKEEEFESGTKEEDEFGELVPVYKVRKEEATFTKGDVKLQRITVTETDLQTKNETQSYKSKIPQLRLVFEKVADDNRREKENKVSTTPIKPRRSSIPRLRFKANADIPLAKNEKTIQIYEKPNDNRTDSKRAEVILVNTMIKDNTLIKSDAHIIKQDVNINVILQPEAEFDKIYETTVDEKEVKEGKHVEEVTTLIKNDADIINTDIKTVSEGNSNAIVEPEAEFDKIYDTVAVEKVKKEGKSFKEVTTLIKSDEDIIKQDDEILAEDKTDVIVETEDEFDKIYKTIAVETELKDKIRLEEEVPVTIDDSEVMETNFERIVNEYKENKIRPLDLDLGKRKSRIPFRKQKSLHDVLPKRAERRSSLKEFQNEELGTISINTKKVNNKKSDTKSDQLLNKDSIIDINKDQPNKKQDNGTKIDKFRENNETNEIIVEKSISNDHVEINSTKDIKDEDTDAIRLSISSRIAIFERQPSSDINRKYVKKEKEAINTDVAVEEIQKIDKVLKIQPKRQINNENNAEHNKKDDVLFLFPRTQDCNYNSERDNFNEFSDNFFKPNDIYEEKVKIVATVLKDLDKPVNYVEFEEIKIANIDEIDALENITKDNETVFSVEKEVYNNNKTDNDKEAKDMKTVNDTNSKNEENKTPRNKGSNFKTISISQLQKNLIILPTMPRDNHRRKSAADMELEEKLKGKVKSMVVKIKSIENLTDEVRMEENFMINERERPRRKSVSEKIALFEAKSAASRRIEDKGTFTFKGMGENTRNILSIYDSKYN